MYNKKNFKFLKAVYKSLADIVQFGLKGLVNHLKALLFILWEAKLERSRMIRSVRLAWGILGYFYDANKWQWETEELPDIGGLFFNCLVDDKLKMNETRNEDVKWER